MTTLEQLRSGTLAGSRRLKLACGLRQFPEEIFDLAETLEILDLSGNSLSALPDDFYRLRQLRILFCSDNQFTELPAVLGQCPQLSMIGFKANLISTVPAAALPRQLRWLILTDNRISELPAQIGACRQLQKLMLAGNRLQSLPQALANCSRLELLRISANQLAALPEWLLCLPRLAWLAYAGNPFAAGSPVEPAPSARIGWHQLQLENQLGEGASGVIYQAAWQRNDERHPVAVKLFKGEVTSDGLPQHEMAACVGAGAHANLIPVLGCVDQHPAATHGLVMALIDQRFQKLAGPPSLESCTRDIYAAETSFSISGATRIALGIASAAAHLHARGILHGDLYAHNILHCADGDALLGDFGAASFFNQDDQTRAEALQRIEVRAFGCLLEELIERSTVTVDAGNALKLLVALQADCVRHDVNERPSFREITQILANAMKA